MSAIVCGAIYMVIGPAPAIKRAESAPPSRPLAYQDKIARAAEEAKEAVPQVEAAPPQEMQATPEAGAGASAPEQGSTDMAALSPDQGAANDPNALPWQHPAPPDAQAAPGMDGEATGPMAPPPGEYGGSPNAMPPPPGADADPNALPAGPGEEPQEWVQVLVSGVGMRGTASEDAPMLFAFPYGRVLRVVSRYQDWVEVTDPQSAATGWMEARYLAPVAAPGTQQNAGAMYDEEVPRWRWRWWRKHGGGGIADMINRTFGGY